MSLLVLSLQVNGGVLGLGTPVGGAIGVEEQCFERQPRH
jgi:hypothetical protein